MVITTTPTVENGEIIRYCGLVTGDVVAGINFIKDFGASVRNIVGGRSSGYEKEIIKARQTVIQQMQEEAMNRGANAIVGVSIDYESFGNAGMVMVNGIGTAVVVQNRERDK